MSGEVVGFYNAAGVPSVDSFALTLLIDMGIPGFLFYFGMIAFGLWATVRSYLSSWTARGAIAGPLACSLLAYGFYRFYLSQTENQTLFYVLVGFTLWLIASARSQRTSVQPSSAERTHLERPTLA